MGIKFTTITVSLIEGVSEIDATEVAFYAVHEFLKKEFMGQVKREPQTDTYNIGCSRKVEVVVCRGDYGNISVSVAPKI